MTLFNREVRWRKTRDEHWKKGRLVEDRNATLLIAEARSGNMRSIPPGQVQMAISGPRGGKQWTAYQRTLWHATGSVGSGQQEVRPSTRDNAESTRQARRQRA